MDNLTTTTGYTEVCLFNASGELVARWRRLGNGTTWMDSDFGKANSRWVAKRMRQTIAAGGHVSAR